MALDDDLQELIEKRREIDRALLERHAVEMAVLFTDIVGSTAYFEQRGDIEGLALVHRHNALLFPVVKLHGGRVVKTIGDSIMAVFTSSAEGIACAVALQETLAQETGADERIRIRVGVHFGRVLKDGDDVFGDTVNTAARVASSAEGDEVIASQASFDALPRGHAWQTTPKRPLSAKGKSAPVPIVAIAWRDSDRENARAVSPAARELFLIEMQRGPSGLRVAAMDGEGERGTVKAYADVALVSDDIDRLGEPFAVLAHDGGQSAYADALVEKGRALFERTLPERVRRRLLETTRRTVRLHLEDTLVHVPWELLHDGSDFLGCKFSVGRMVSARQDASVPPSTNAGDIVVLANCSGDLPHAEEEGRVVEKLFAQALGPDRVVHRSGRITRAAFLEVAGRARVLHVAGHVSKQNGGGFVVADGIVSAGDLRAALAHPAGTTTPGATGQVPLLVFANGCHASTSTPWQDQGGASAGMGLAQGLLLAGVRHTLAPMWSVPDADALSFALRFYEGALAGVPFGESARRARKALATTHAAPLSFAGYVLYGDPRAVLPAEDARLPAIGRTRSGDFPPANVPVPVPVPVPVSGASAPWAPRQPHAPAAALPEARAGHGTSTLTLGVIGGLLVGVALVAGLVIARGTGDDAVAQPVTDAGEGSALERAPIAPVVRDAQAASAAPKIVHAGPVRVSVMPFASTGASDASLDYLKLGLSEVLVTAFAGTATGTGVQIIERGQIDVDIAELDFAQSRYVDPKTRAALGKIAGAEVAVLGAWQLAGRALRFTARFVDVETGEVLSAAKVDGSSDDVFALQDALAVEANKAMVAVAQRMRP